MFNLISTNTAGQRALYFGAFAAVIYVIMLFGTLAELERIAEAKVFDLRPMGYSFADAVALIGALGGEGKTIYLTQQLPLDALYPAAFCLALVHLIRWLERLGSKTVFHSIAVWLSVAAMVSDDLENLLIATMLISEATPVIVKFASAATISKSVFTTVCITTVLVLAVSRFVVWTRSATPNRA